MPSRNISAKIQNPFIENFLITLGALIANLIIFGIFFFGQHPIIEWNWIILGLPFFSGILWSIAGLFAFLAIGKIGTGKAFSIWAPSGMVVSFLWGILYYKEFSSNLFMAIAAVSIVVIGISLVIRSREKNTNSKLMFSGVAFALGASCIWGGTYLIPIKELAIHTSPFVTLLPLSLGMVVGASLIAIAKGEKNSLNISIMKKGYLIVFSGILWALGNLFATLSVLSIGIGKAYPLAELCGVVNALFSVFFLREITDKKRIFLFLSGTLLSFAGAIWLAYLKI